jgi:uncharacterized membrane protein YgaE (UPF0421/DUF939 family)
MKSLHAAWRFIVGDDSRLVIGAVAAVVISALLQTVSWSWLVSISVISVTLMVCVFWRAR